jgi:hypothetical protein
MLPLNWKHNDFPDWGPTAEFGTVTLVAKRVVEDLGYDSRSITQEEFKIGAEKLAQEYVGQWFSFAYYDFDRDTIVLAVFPMDLILRFAILVRRLYARTFFTLKHLGFIEIPDAESCFSNKWKWYWNIIEVHRKRRLEYKEHGYRVGFEDGYEYAMQFFKQAIDRTFKQLSE